MQLLSPRMAVVLQFHTVCGANPEIGTPSQSVNSVGSVVTQLSSTLSPTIITINKRVHNLFCKKQLDSHLYLDLDGGKLVEKAPMEAGQLHNLES